MVVSCCCCCMIFLLRAGLPVPVKRMGVPRVSPRATNGGRRAASPAGSAGWLRDRRRPPGPLCSVYPVVLFGRAVTAPAIFPPDARTELAALYPATAGKLGHALGDH